MRLILALALTLAPCALLASCAYKKEVKKSGPYALECEVDLVKSKKRGRVVTAYGCTREERYYWYCEKKDCKLLGFRDAIELGAFSTDCSYEETVAKIVNKTQLQVDGCGRKATFKPTLNGWEEVGG